MGKILGYHKKVATCVLLAADGIMLSKLVCTSVIGKTIRFDLEKLFISSYSGLYLIIEFTFMCLLYAFARIYFSFSNFVSC